MGRVRRTRWLLAVVFVIAGLICGACTNVPPPKLAVPTPSAPPPAPEPRQLVFAVDDLGQGFNPHLLSDLSPISAAVASLVLPSVFRPGPDGALTLNPAVATSARVVSTAPFTVSYELALSASWSDNTPIAAEDFVYLWERMRREPGVVDSAGYRLITDVRSRAGGKAVDVVFAQRYPQWPMLFSDLLPAHLLKDAPRGWSTALADNIPVSGGPFQLSSVDRDRGQLVLARNDHYWATPAVLDSLVLRRSDPTGMVDGLRKGELALAQTWPDQATLNALRQPTSPLPGQTVGQVPGQPASRQPGQPAVPGEPAAAPVAPAPVPPVPQTPPVIQPIRLQPVAQPVVVQLGMRTDSGVLSDERVRRAVAAMLNRDALIALGTDNGVGGVRVDSQLLAPTTPGYRATIPAGSPAHPDPKLAEQLLTAAGYARDGQGRWASQGNPLQLVVGTPSGRTRFGLMAEEIRKELVAGGIDALVVTPSGASLYTDPTVPAPPPSPTPEPGLVSAPVSVAAAPQNAQGGINPPGAVNPKHPENPPGQRTGAAAVPGAPGGQAPGPAAAAGQPGQGSVAATSTAPPPPPAGVRVDLEIQPRAVGADLATEAVSSYGCPPGMAGVDQPARNSTGFCSPDLQPVLDACLSGGLTADQVASGLEPILWRQLPAIPLFQMVTTLASTPDGDRATGNIAPGPLLIGPLGNAPAWHPING
ncbi:MAG TPA: ABC transporter family substrate-binding protein [Pseudonocardia sp.]|nr:ABC transporter family substrate-binding protein [Pseudonocardia sp.]